MTGQLVSTLLDAAVTISESGKEMTPEEKENLDRRKEEKAKRDHRQEMEYRQGKSTLNSERDYWKNDVMRKTPVHPGERLTGYIHLPIDEKAELIREFIPTERDTFMVEFLQSEIKPVRL